MNADSELFQLVLIGIHGAGKTTLGTLLSKRLGIPFDGEIGKVLRGRELAKNQHCHALAPLKFFDAEVMHREMLRDISVERSRVVETWHPGNLAFCRERNPAIFERYRPLVATHIASLPGKILVQPLHLARETARMRQTECGDNAEELHDFFWQVAAQAESLAHEFGLHVLPTVWTDQAAPGDCCKAIATNLHQALEKNISLTGVADKAIWQTTAALFDLSISLHC